MNNLLKFKKNESFYIRDGWFEKALNEIFQNSELNIFSKNNGMHILGIGSNMVKGLKYWLCSANLISANSKNVVLSKFGELIMKYDRYLESNFSWFLIHYFLSSNMIECPIFYGIFNIDIKSFSKTDAVEMFISHFISSEYSFKKEYIEDDLNVFLKSYINDNKYDNPEDNYVCPLSNLKLLSKRNDRYYKTRPQYFSLSYLIVYYSLIQMYDENSFIIEESMEEYNSPVKIFNLDKNMFLQYLEEMKKNNLIIINKTAGLNTVYFNKKLTLNEIFEEYFGG